MMLKCVTIYRQRELTQTLYIKQKLTQIRSYIYNPITFPELIIGTEVCDLWLGN